jgi:hypothetical protein
MASTKSGSVGDAPDDPVRPAAEEAGRDAREPAHPEDERYRKDGDREIEARRDDHAAEDVAAELVRAEPVSARGGLQRRRRVRSKRVVGRDPGSEHRADHEQRQQAEGEPRYRVVRDHEASMR